MKFKRIVAAVLAAAAALMLVSCSDSSQKTAEGIVDKLLNCTVKQADEIFDNLGPDDSADADAVKYFSDKYEAALTDACIEKFIGTRVLLTAADYARKESADIVAKDVKVEARSGDKKVYDYAAKLETADGKAFDSVYGSITINDGKATFLILNKSYS